MPGCKGKMMGKKGGTKGMPDAKTKPPGGYGPKVGGKLAGPAIAKVMAEKLKGKKGKK